MVSIQGYYGKMKLWVNKPLTKKLSEERDKKTKKNKKREFPPLIKSERYLFCTCEMKSKNEMSPKIVI
jgi:hypothetical protein